MRARDYWALVVLAFAAFEFLVAMTTPNVVDMALGWFYLLITITLIYSGKEQTIEA